MKKNYMPLGVMKFLLILIAAFVALPHTVYTADFNIPPGDVNALIGAINLANNNNEDDTINLEAGTYTLLQAGLPSITSNIIINGAGTDSTIIIRDDGAPDFGIFEMITDTGILKMDGLTLRGGSPVGGEGGAILSKGKVTITNSTITDNHPWDFGGGIDNRGTMTITNSTISNNSSWGAGGIANRPGGTLTMVNCTVSGNSSGSAGGGIAAQGTTILINTTISNNDATEGGGIWNSGIVELKNSIVANNTAGGDCFVFLGGIISLDYNLDSDGTCNLIQPHDLPNTDPLLGEFTDDGTPGRGHFPLLKGSPAIDKGNDDACPSTDQLGNPRVDGDVDGKIDCDIGSIEYQGQPGIFVDVPPGYWAEEHIYKIYEAGITTGCSKNPLMYCPKNPVNRDQMAVFLGRATHDSNFTPPDATGIFADVPKWYWAADWIEQFYADGLTKGCKRDPHDPQSPVMYYCPKYPVTRTTMAIFLLRAKHGANYQPPLATGIFGDVWVNYWAADWIEQLYKEGITKGCNQNPLMYCPANHVTRAQMAAFLARMLGL